LWSHRRGRSRHETSNVVGPDRTSLRPVRPIRFAASTAATRGHSKHQIFVLKTEHHTAPAAADMFVLIGNVLTAGHEVRQNSTERQTFRQAGGARRLEDARGKQRAALRDLGRLELVAQALL